MRNLKKILALVLALVMSLSLMATAGAAETTAAVSNPYQTAQEVLEGLKVFQGNPGGAMNYDQSITRVQTAALVYRIATSDVTDTQRDMYTNHAFKDVAPTYWGNGYIGYGYNAEIIKGMGDGTFNPDGQVTGYQTLAMILRTLGYGRNHEFEGANWEVQTAATAKREGLLEGVTAADETRLGQPASRGLVAQILFNALLQKTVKFSALNPYNYEPDTNTTLGWQKFKLEKITGVVIANEWAALDASTPLAADKTKVELADGTYRTLNWSAGDKETGADYATGVKDIGKSRDAYITSSKVLFLADSGKNSGTKDNEGKKTTVNALKSGLTVNDTTLHFTNFEPTEKITNDLRIEITLTLGSGAIGGGALQFNISKATLDKVLGVPTVDADGTLHYKKVLPANTEVNEQVPVMKEIFRIADDGDLSLKIKGEVFVGTRTDVDQSNSMSYAKFDEEYLTHDKKTVSSVGNGDWLQIVDNDDDGIAEYVLLVNYELDEIVEAKSDKFYYRGLDLDDFTPVEIEGYTQAVGDIVLYAAIDGKAYVHKADTASASFKSVNYKDRTATTTEGDVKEQSDIVNHTTKPGTLTDVDELTSYNMYLDDYGYVRAYDNNVGYALLTEVYPTSDWNSAWVVNRELTAEAMPVGDTAVREYKVLNSWYNGGTNPFFIGHLYQDGTWYNRGWTYPGITNIRNNMQYADRANYLQQATHMLGTAEEGFVFDYSDTDWYVKNNATANWTNFNTKSWTNVAKYTQTENGLNLYTAAGKTGDVTTDYIRLDSSVTALRTINKNDPLFPIEDQYYDEVYTSAANHYVRAVDSTVFFLVTVNKNGTTQAIRQYTGYSNVPTITDENSVRSMYAVAHTNNPNDVNVNTRNYWVGDVIVIEMYDYNAYESISLIYSNDYKNQGDVKYVEAIDSLKGEIRIIPNNYNVWNGRFAGYGFYGLNNIIAVEGQENTYTADIVRITDDATAADPGYLDDNNYNKYGIYYGQVRSLWSEDGFSNYITLDILDQNDIVVGTKDVRVTLGAWGIKDNTNYNSAVPLLLKSTTVNNKVVVGDKVIWVETSGTGDARTAGFLVDLTDTDYSDWSVSGTKRSYNPTPKFLSDEGKLIALAQWTGRDIDVVKSWNYEEIIGKRNDQSAARTAAPQDGFVIDSYNLYLNNNTVAEVPVDSGVKEDGLWHIRYNIPEGAAVRVEIDRNDLMLKDLVLNSTRAGVVSTKFYSDGVTVQTEGTGIDVFKAETWSFTMPVLKVNEKVVGTIFEDGTTIPAAILYPVSEANRYELNKTQISVGGTVVPQPGTITFKLTDDSFQGKVPADVTVEPGKTAVLKVSDLSIGEAITMPGASGVTYLDAVVTVNGTALTRVDGEYTIPANTTLVEIKYVLTDSNPLDTAPEIPDTGDDDDIFIPTDPTVPAEQRMSRTLSAGRMVWNVGDLYTTYAYVTTGKTLYVSNSTKYEGGVVEVTTEPHTVALSDAPAHIAGQNPTDKNMTLWALTFKLNRSLTMPKLTTKDPAGEKPVEVPAEVRAAIVGNVYNFYGYGYNQNVELKEDVAKAALAAALKKDEKLDLAVSDITFDGNKAICKVSGGATRIFNIVSGKTTSGSWQKTAQQWAVSYNGQLKCYAYLGETFNLTGLMSNGYIVSDSLGVTGSGSSTAVNDKGVATVSGFGPGADVNFVDALVCTFPNAMGVKAVEAYNGSSWVTATSQWVTVGTPIRVQVDSLPKTDGIRYQVYTSDGTNIVNKIGNVIVGNTLGDYVEIGNLSKEYAVNGTASFGIKQVYDVTIDGKSIGYHYATEEIAVPDLAAGTVIMGSRNTAAADKWAGLVTVKDTNTDYYTTVQKADDSHKQPYFTLSTQMATAANKGNTAGSIALYTANEVEFSGTIGAKIKLTNGDWSAEDAACPSSGETWYISNGTTIDLTSSAENKLYRVTKGTTSEDVGTIGSSSTTASFKIDGDITIAEIDAAKKMTLILHNGSYGKVAAGAKTNTGVIQKGAQYNAANWDTTGATTKTVDYTKCEIKEANGHEDSFVNNADYIVTITGLKPVDPCSFAQLTSVAFVAADGTQYEIVNTPTITQVGDGTVNITFTFQFK